MEIWIIQDGDKRGPFQEYEIRRLFEDGKIDADTRLWHAHLDAWRPLREVEGLKHLAEEIRAAEIEQPAEEPAAPAKESATPPLPKRQDQEEQEAQETTKPHLVRRFWARWFDLCGYSALWWLLMWVSGRDIAQLFSQPWVMLLLYVPWFAVEAWLIHRFSTTPGKWLLGIKVINEDGTPLDLGMSVARSVRVLFMGIGFGLQPLALICQGISWITARKSGRPLWDRAGHHLVDVRPLSVGPVVACAILLMSFLWLESIVLLPHYLPDMIQLMEQHFPDAAQQMRDQPPWHLPVK